MHRLRRRLASSEGFTLIELLVVIVIIGILLAIAIPSYLGFRKQAQDTAGEANVREAVPSAESYFASNNTYVGHGQDRAEGDRRRAFLGRHPQPPDGGHLLPERARPERRHVVLRRPRRLRRERQADRLLGKQNHLSSPRQYERRASSPPLSFALKRRNLLGQVTRMHSIHPFWGRAWAGRRRYPGSQCCLSRRITWIVCVGALRRARASR